MFGCPFRHDAIASGRGSGYSALFRRLSLFGTGPSFQSGSTPAAGPRRVPFPRVSRAPLRGRAGASCAGAVRAPDCARETADARLPSAPAGVFCGPSRSPAQKSRKAALRPPFCSHSTTLFPQSSPRPRDYPVRIDRARLPAYVEARRRGGRVVIHRTANPLTPVRIRSAPPRPSSSPERAAIRAPVRVCSAVAQWQSGRLLTDWS